MEEIIVGLLEKSLVGGAFMYLLYMFISKFSKSQEGIVEGLGKMSSTLTDISNSLHNLDERVKKLEGERYE